MNIVTIDFYDNYEGTDPFWNVMAHIFGDDITDQDVPMNVYTGMEKELEEVFLSSIVFCISEELTNQVLWLKED